MKNFMIRVFVASLLITSLLPSAFANKKASGDLNCHYNIMSKHSWPTIVKTEPFLIDINKVKFVSTDSEILDRTIRMRYTPGHSKGKLSHFVFSLTYNGVHAGADIPIANGQITIKIGSDDNDMIGGFLICTAKLK